MILPALPSPALEADTELPLAAALKAASRNPPISKPKEKNLSGVKLMGIASVDHKVSLRQAIATKIHKFKLCSRRRER